MLNGFSKSFKVGFLRGELMQHVTLKGSPVEVIGQVLKTGTHAPEITGIDADFKERSLKEFKGKKKIICFVPSLDTAVCSLSAKKFNEKMESKSNTAVIYCSMDLPFVFKRVCEHLSHVTPLSLFHNPKIAEAYGALQSSGPLKGLCARAVFVIDEHDKVVYHELVKEITTEPDYDKALAYLY
jgi:thiol peroxidase